jgi:hypothetical protein
MAAYGFVFGSFGRGRYHLDNNTPMLVQISASFETGDTPAIWAGRTYAAKRGA